LFIKYNRSTP